MTIAINDSGTWRYPWAVYIKDGSTWRRVTSPGANGSGTWRSVLFIGLMTVGKGGTNNTWGWSSAIASSLMDPPNALTGTVDSNGYGMGELYFTTSDNKTRLSYDATFGGTAPSGSWTQTNYVKRLLVGAIEVDTSSAAEFSNLAPSVVQWRWTGDVFSLQNTEGTTKVVQFTPA